MAFSVVRVTSLTASQAKILFNDDIDTSVGVGNVAITSSIDSVPDVTITSVSIDSDEMTVNFHPIFYNTKYTITFSSTSSQNFQTADEEAIMEDGHRNAIFLFVPEESDIQQDMLDSLSVIYESEQPSLIKDLVTATSTRLEEVDRAIETVKSANYLSVLVEDELMTRGAGPTDEFSNGGVFELIRAGTNVSGATKSGTLRIDSERYASFVSSSYVVVNNVLQVTNDDPISLQSVDVINEQVSSDTDLDNYFDGLTINVAHKPVIQLISVTLKRDGVYVPYDVNTFGYTLRENKYDTAHALKNVTLETQQIQLSSSSITGESDGFLNPIATDTMYVSYVYKNLGRDISSVSTYTLKQSVREAADSVTTSFSLNYAPIVLSNDSTPTTGGVIFYNTTEYNGQAPFTTSHPAFLNEIPFDLGRVPRKPGQYSVNYSTGQVLVYGEDATNQGTGSNPPLVTYYYRSTFVEDLDYTFNSDTNDLAFNETRNLDELEVKIALQYEDSFVEDEDYRFLSHVESIDERIGNKLISDLSIQTNHFPITDVFRIFNETTGEVYKTTRFNDHTITFSGRKAPVQIDITRERVSFSLSDQETLFVSDELTNTYGLRVFKVVLENDQIGDSKQRFIGANFDTSVTFSDTDIFKEERFYEDELFTSVTTNINRFTTIGDYSVDYSNGIVYVAVSDSQDGDLGEISYRYADIVTKNDHILKASNIYRSNNASSSNISTYTPTNISDTTIEISGLESVGERFINGSSVRSIIIGTYQSGEDGYTVSGSNIFSSNTATFTADDVGRALIVGSSSDTPVQQVEISSILSTHQVIVDDAFTYSSDGRVWVILDVSSGADKTITLENNIISINDIYLVNQLGSVPFSSLDGYYDINTDTFEENVITLGASNPLSVGDAVIVNYNPGNIYADYRYLKDDILVSYEYGKNSIDWSVSNTLDEDDEYFVTYKYGALRDPLLLNFGALTQIPVLSNFPYDFDREVYRSVVGGTLQSFVKGPTIPAIKQLVEAFTDVTPTITEEAFNNWVLGRDYLNLNKIKTNTAPIYDVGKFNNGISVEAGQNIQVSAVSHLRLEEGTLETWVRPQWKGLDNDATITFDLYKDGYRVPTSVFIGYDAENPTEVPFDLTSSGETVIGQPKNIDDAVGYFIWYDDIENQWNIRWREENNSTHDFVGTISTSGELFKVEKPTSDGYDINEITDLITSSIKTIDFSAVIDGYEPSGDYSSDGISFASGDSHYLLDMAGEKDANRFSIYKNGSGYLNFRIIDNGKEMGDYARVYSISKDVSDWEAGSIHHIAVGWKLNTYNKHDEMHLFVDGQETPNLFKYGGFPIATSQTFGSIGEESVVSLATSPTIGGYDGVSIAGTSLFRSVGADFEEAGVKVGDTLRIFEENADGTEDSQGGVYTITGVGTNTLTIDRGLTLSLSGIDFSINPVVSTVTTPVNLQKFAVYTTDVDGNETELNGTGTDDPDYSISRGSNYTHILTIKDGIDIGDAVAIKTYGLIFRRCKDQMFVYSNNDSKIRTNSPYPATLGDVDITAILLEKRLVSAYNDEFALMPDGSLFSSFGGDGYNSHFRDGYIYEDGYICQPSNQVNGRRLSLLLSGDNINYGVNKGNRAIITGRTWNNDATETLYFTENGPITTSEYWVNIETIEFYVVPIDSSEHAGIIEVREYKPINESENNGDFASIADFTNGIFDLEIYGSGGLAFDLKSCLYEIDYPTYLKINVDTIPDKLYIGSDFEESNEFDGVIDELRILNTMYSDLRTGETSTTGTDITSNYNKTSQFDEDNNTTLLMHFNDNLNDSADYLDSFDFGFEVAESVNTIFGKAMKISTNRKYEIGNATNTFNNDEGTLEFWVSPLMESQEDPMRRYYLDASSSTEETLTSSTRLNITTSRRVKEIVSVRLASDDRNIGTEYFSGGSVSNIDGKTITLGIPLPNQNTSVKVRYIPQGTSGDRVSIFKDTNGSINFFLSASEVEHMITVQADWDRNTWHRIMVMWKANSTDNNDRIRLFVDGSERGTIKYGTGLLYGTGVIYGQAEIRAGINRYVVDNIDLTDTFSKLYVGTDYDGLNNGMARIDNMRFSDVQRLTSIRTVGNSIIDTNYNSNDDLANPVVDDDDTTLLLNFNKQVQVITDLITLQHSNRGLYRFQVDVIDSFGKIGDSEVLQQLLRGLINTLKPAHAEYILNFI